MKNYELIEHTADVGIKVRAKDLKELFRKTALSMFDIIAKPKQESGASKEIQIKLKTDDSDELLITWLNELLFLSATKELIFFDFNINKLENTNLEAIVTGRDIKNYQMNAEIKAATYHELKIEKIKSGWEAQVIFDV